MRHGRQGLFIIIIVITLPRKCTCLRVALNAPTTSEEI